MAIAQKYTTAAATKTHGLEDATVLEILIPTVPLDGTGNMIRAAAHGFAGYMFRGYKENKNFSL